jgi:uncharacterized protein (DUF58 family)
MYARRAMAVLATGGVLLLVSLIFDAAPLFVPAVALVVLGAGAPAWVWLAARGARTERHLPTGRVIEDLPIQATIEVRRGRLGLPGAEVIDPFTGSRFELSQIRGERTAHVHVRSRFPRRGLHRLPAPSLTVRDPLELARAEAVGTGPPQQMLVLPRTEPVRWLGAGHGRRLQLPDGDAGSEAMAAVDLDGLRPYRPGTPASRIHWPAVARGAGLIERRLQADGDTRPLVILDARTPVPGDPACEEMLDAAVRAAASLVLELAGSGGCGLLLPGESRPTAIDRELSAWPAAYARLAVVQSSGARAPALSNVTGRAASMLYVAAWPVERLGAILTGPGGRATVLVVPEQSLVNGRPRAVRGSARLELSVCGCRGFRLGAGRRVEREPAEELAS